MTVQTLSALAPQTYETANLIAMASFIDTTLIGGGWLRTADTGQLDISTLVGTSTQNTVLGYKVYKSNDGLTDIYLKVEFGVSGGSSWPGIWFTAGLGSNGSGTITSICMSRYLLYATGNSPVASQNYGAAGPSWFSFGLFLDIQYYAAIFTFERRKDSTQQDVNTGIVINRGWYNPAVNRYSYCIPFTGSVPPAQVGFQTILSNDNPVQFDGKQQIGLIRPMIGYADPACLGLVMCNSSDIANWAIANVVINGVTHIYRHCGPYLSGNRVGSVGSETATRLLMRWE
jgi:hypothetical protein